MQVGDFVGGGVFLLAVPEGFGKAFHHEVFGVVAVLLVLAQLVVDAGDAERAVGADLFTNGDVQAHMEERVTLAEFGSVIFCQSVVVSGQCRVVLRVFGNDLGDQAFQGFEIQSVLMFLPGIDIDLA